ncbi:MAG: type II toxin-antitoxin system VapC family toxin, partial [Bacillota bacterium]
PEPMKSYVIDASVAVKWYIPEPLSDAADQYLQLYKDQRARLLAPDLLIVEVGSVLWKKSRSNEIAGDDAREIMHAFTLHSPLSLIQSSQLMPSALDLAMAQGLTVYDSLYLVLAIAVSAKLVTADSDIDKLAEGSPFSGQVILLKNNYQG